MKVKREIILGVETFIALARIHHRGSDLHVFFRIYPRKAVFVKLVKGLLPILLGLLHE
jgi:hypothetical protein